MMNRNLKILLLVFFFFSTYYIVDYLYFNSLRAFLYEKFNHIGIAHIITYIIVGLPIFVGTLVIKSGNFLKNLGLDKSLLKGLLIAFVFTLPMFLGYAYFFNFNKEISIDKILIGVVCAGFFEELYFRGFLFGQVFRNTKIGFIPSILFGAILFALGHLYQSQELGQLVGIFATTFLGAILFAWVYCEWNYNLWVSIFLHLFMNLSWTVFAVSENAFGGTYANIFRIITIVFVIAFTVIYKLKRGEKLIINRQTIL